MIRGVAITAMAALSLTAARAADGPKTPKSIWEQDTLTGDWGGARTALKDKGVDLTLTYINEAFGVLSGGLNRQASYEGRFEFSVDTDLQKLVGWNGAMSSHLPAPDFAVCSTAPEKPPSQESRTSPSVNHSAVTRRPSASGCLT